MKKHLSLLLALVLLLGVFSLCGCSNNEEAEITQEIEVPESYNAISFNDGFYGICFQSAVPECESIETDEQYSGYCVYKCTVDSLSGKNYVITAYSGVGDEEAKNDSFFGFTGETDVTTDGDVIIVRAEKPTFGTERETDYTFLAPFLDGFAMLTVQLSSISESMSDEEWAAVTDSIGQYAQYDILEENQLVTDKGKLVDRSRTMTFDNPSKISGADAELSHTVKRDLVVRADFTLDGIDHIIYANGDVSESAYNALIGDSEAFTECEVGKNTYYCSMSNSFPDAKCEVYTERDGVYYSFTVIRCHNFDAVKNQDYVDDAENNRFFAKLVDSFISNAKIDTSEYLFKTN